MYRRKVVTGEERVGMRLCSTLRLDAGRCSKVNGEVRIGIRFCTTVRRVTGSSSEVIPVGA
jgi:hypothetical protein